MNGIAGKAARKPIPEIRIVAAGDGGTGKSTLISTAATGTYPLEIASVLPPTKLPDDMFPDYHIPITVIDTSSRIEDRGKFGEELKRADVAILTYACDEPATLDRLATFWLPELRRLEVKVPVIVVGCKLDLRHSEPLNLEKVMSPIIEQFDEIESCIECSAYENVQIYEVFYSARKPILYPTKPLYDLKTRNPKPRLLRALRRIFNLHYQDNVAVGVVGLSSLNDFLTLHTVNIENGRPEMTWTLLRKYGYNDALVLDNNYFPLPIERAADQSVELTNEVMDFLRRIFHLNDINQDGVLTQAELEHLFSMAPQTPWDEALGELSLDDFLSQWALMTLLDPIHSVENLVYIGYGGDPCSAIRVTRRRELDGEEQESDRTVFQCFVFGPKSAGKSALFGGQGPTVKEGYVARTVDQPGGSKKTLVFRDIPEDGVVKLLSDKDSLVSCDVAVFIHDISGASTWKKAKDMLVEVSAHGEASRYKLPCLLILAGEDDDVESNATEMLIDFTRVSQDMGLDAPIRLNTYRMGNFNNIFRKIVNAAEHPYVSTPETEAEKMAKQFRRQINRVVVSAAVTTVIVLSVYRAYAARKNSSS